MIINFNCFDSNTIFGGKKVKNFSKVFMLLFTALTVIVLAACGNNDKEKDASTAAKDDSTYKVEHAMGTTEIKGEPKRVVVLTNEGTEAVLALGVKPVGAVQSFLGDPWYEHIQDKMDGAEVVGLESELNIEKIASLKPDLIIGNKLRQEKDYAKLSKIAPTVFSETLRGDWQENFKLYAKALNKEDEGTKILDDYTAHVDKVKTALGDKTDQEVSVVRFMADLTRIYYTDSFSGVILNQLGFKRAPAQADMFKDDAKLGNLAIEVGKESIPDMDADVLFYFTYAPGGDETATKTEQEWTSDKLWKNLNVVKSGNAHKVDDAIWNTAGGILAANIMLDQLQEIMTK